MEKQKWHFALTQALLYRLSAWTQEAECREPDNRWWKWWVSTMGGTLHKIHGSVNITVLRSRFSVWLGIR